ncbi:MAG: peptidase M23 [Microbacterium sp.]|nr:MAG: peptidase M23 [Microbacterium sp.]
MISLRSRLALAARALAIALASMTAASAAGAPGDALEGWEWPVSPVRIVESYLAPAHRYGPGHRGIDLAAPRGTEVTAPADGIIAFVGVVAGRPVLTIDHGSGLVTTLEPVTASVPVDAAVHAGEVVGVADVGGHAALDTIHFGVRKDGEYINPMLLLAGIPRAVLLAGIPRAVLLAGIPRAVLLPCC